MNKGRVWMSRSLRLQQLGLVVMVIAMLAVVLPPARVLHAQGTMTVTISKSNADSMIWKTSRSQPPESAPIAAAWHASAADLGEPAAPQDTPIVLVSEYFSDWTMAGGFVYWSATCSVQARAPSYLRRVPVGGGIKSTLASAPEAECVTYYPLAADESGVYYYNFDAERIEHRPTSSPHGSPTIVRSSLPRPNPLTGLLLDGSFIYWAATDIYRVGRDGSGFATFVANPTAFWVSGIVADATHVYWTDSNGLWRADKSCAPLPCTSIQPLASGAGRHPFLYGGFVYWVSHLSTGAPQILRVPITGGMPTVLYTAPTDYDWLPGQLGTDGTSLFFKEIWWEIEGGPHARLRRLPIDGGTAVSIADDMTLMGAGSEKLFTDARGVYFGGQSGLSLLPFDAAALVRDFVHGPLEVTQGIQSLANDVPLVADKPTYVRFFPRQSSGPPSGTVNAYLYGQRNGSPLPGSPLSPIRVGSPLTATTHLIYDRGDRANGFLFRLPESWTTSGETYLRAVVNPAGGYDEPNTADNVRTGVFNFTRKASVCVMFVPVRTHSPRPSVNDPNVGLMLDYFKRIWPVSDVWIYPQDDDIAELQGRIGIPPWYYDPYEVESDGWKIISSLVTRDLLTDDPNECDDAGARTHYVGMVHPQADTGTTVGLANLYLAAAWVKFPSHGPMSLIDWLDSANGDTMGQELAHNYTRYHVDCGGPEDVDSSYPYPPCQIGHLERASHYGFDVNSLTPIAPDRASDYMSYDTPAWTSDYTWKALYGRIANRPTEASTSTARPETIGAGSLTAEASAVLVTGTLLRQEVAGVLNHAWVLPTDALGPDTLRKWEAIVAVPYGGPALAGATAPTYHVRLLDPAGTVLADWVVEPKEIARHHHDATASFALAFPAPAGIVARIELLADSTVLATLTPGTGVPTVHIAEPAGGETITDRMTVVWYASDPDADDQLLFTVQYSPDNGQSWRVLASEIPGEPDGDALTLPLETLDGIPGGTVQARIRVIASDGYHTAVDVSEPFRVADRAPRAFIVSPVASTSLPAGQPLLLRAFASDAETGGLPSSAFMWTVDGLPVGLGHEQRVDGLAPGAHPVTLTVHDAAGNETTVQTVARIDPLGLPAGTAPELDGTCDDAAYVDAPALQLSPYADGSQATVRLLRTPTDLWACFGNLKRGTGNGSFAGLRVDMDNSRDDPAQAGDHGFFAGEDGRPWTASGDGQGGFDAPGPEGLIARTAAGTSAWSAELRIPASVLGGWNQVVGLKLGQYWVNGVGDDYHWPHRAGWIQPSTWAITVLGSLPHVTGLSPDSATVGDPQATLTITGTDFVQGATVHWRGSDLPTTFTDPTELRVVLPASALAMAGQGSLAVRNPGLAAALSNEVVFTVNNPTPVVAALTPSQARPGCAPFALTVIGSGFVPSTMVLWNGEPRPTTFVSPTELRAQITAADCAGEGTADIAVLNPDPTERASHPVPFRIESTQLYLPVLRR